MREQNAFNYGAFVKCAEAGVSPQDLYAYGQQTNNVQLMKLAQAAYLGAQVEPMEKAAIMNWLKGIGKRVGDSFSALGDIGTQYRQYKNVGGQIGNLQDDAAGLARKAEEQTQNYERLAQGNARQRGRQATVAKQRATDLVGQSEAASQHADQLTRHRREALKDYGKEVAPAAGIVGGTGLVGTGGLAYGLGDADTTENKMKNMSNQYLGTNFGTQSRLGALFG